MRVATAGSPPAPGIVVVAIDEPTFAEVGLQWPWPRSLHAELIGAIAHAGARTIVLDLLFDTPGRSPDDDRALVEAVGAARNVVLATDLGVVEDRGYSVTQWADPFPALAAAAAGLGVVRLPFDPEGVLRRAPLVVEDRPTLSAAAVMHARGLRAPADAGTPRLVWFNGPPRRGILTVSYYQALDPGRMLPPGIFRDKIVLVGRSLAAPPIDEMTDHFRTPQALRMAGVEVHATIVDALLRGRFVADPFGALVPIVLLSLGVALFAAIVLFRAGPLLALVLLASTALLLAAAGYGLLAGARMRVPVLTPVVALAGVYAAGASYRFALVSRERRLIKRAFQHYVAPAIVEIMLRDPARLRLGGEQYEVTVLFSDIEGFTALAETLTPGDLQRRLSGYFKEMLEQVLAERGTLDKLIGDAIMAYFGCPVADPDHAAQACRAALAMQRRMIDLNRAWGAQGLRGLRTRIGINTGPVIAGNMGTDTIFNFTVLGDCVNLASRLEGVNKEYGSLTIVSEDTWSRVRAEFEARELDWIRVKGKQQPVAIYELAARRGELDTGRRAAFERFAAGLTRYREGCWPAARAAFAAALDLDPADAPSRVFLSRCDHYAAHPPVEPWDGVHTMHTK